MRGSYVAQRWSYDPTLYAPPKYRKACGYDAFVPDPVAGFNDVVPAEVAGVVSDAEASVRALNDRAAPALRPLARLLLRTESIASSKVEGLQVDARTLARAEARSDGGRAPGQQVAEVLANIGAMELAVDETSAAPTIEPAHLVGVHELLMRSAPNARVAGQVRTVQNWIGGNDHNPCGAAFVPPPPEEVARLLHDLTELCNSVHLPPIIQAAVAHAQFETIHPFEDGNGRTGRALVHVLLRRRGLAPSYVPPVSVVLAAQKDRYIDGLTRFREGDVNGWIEQFAVAATQAADLAARYLVSVLALQEDWRVRVREHLDLRSDSAVWAVIDELPGYPVISTAVATAVTGRSKSSTSVAIAQLADAGVLVPISESKRNRSWEAAGLLDLLTELEAAGR